MHLVVIIPHVALLCFSYLFCFWLLFACVISFVLLLCYSSLFFTKPPMNFVSAKSLLHNAIKLVSLNHV